MHPTDLGFARMAAVYEPVLRRILESEAAAQPGNLLPGFEQSPHFGEQILTYTFDPEVIVHINAPAVLDPHKPTRLVLYALPNGNTIPQTIGKQKKPDVDWHFFIQHIGAQTRRLREVLADENIIVAYLQAECRSWPTWRRQHEDSGALIAELIESVKTRVGGPETVDLICHSGGGSMLFGFINNADEIPDWVRRIVWLDANYGYSDEQQHGDRLLEWLQRSPEHFMGVVSYDDRRIKINGKLVVGPTGGDIPQDEHNARAATSRCDAGRKQAGCVHALPRA